MNRIRLMVLVVVLGLFSVTASAQRVFTEGNMVIIDASGMPHTTKPKAQETKATNDTGVPINDHTDIASKVSNEKVYVKFEVSKQVNSTDTDWLNAVNLCKNLNYNNSRGWRLPTQRELMLMWGLKVGLEATGGFSPFAAEHYLSATESYSSGYWHVYFGNGTTLTANKSSVRGYVRCVRDITP